MDKGIRASLEMEAVNRGLQNFEGWTNGRLRKFMLEFDDWIKEDSDRLLKSPNVQDWVKLFRRLLSSIVDTRNFVLFNHILEQQDVVLENAAAHFETGKHLDELVQVVQLLSTWTEINDSQKMKRLLTRLLSILRRKKDPGYFPGRNKLIMQFVGRGRNSVQQLAKDSLESGDITEWVKVFKNVFKDTTDQRFVLYRYLMGHKDKIVGLAREIFYDYFDMELEDDPGCECDNDVDCECDDEFEKEQQRRSDKREEFAQIITAILSKIKNRNSSVKFMLTLLNIMRYDTSAIITANISPDNDEVTEFIMNFEEYFSIGTLLQEYLDREDSKGKFLQDWKDKTQAKRRKR